MVGSGIMADRLTDDVALALLGNTLPTGAILVVLITILGPISGAHFNPAVTLVFALRREIAAPQALALCRWRRSPAALPARCSAHAMFDLPLLQLSQTVRTGPGQWLSEAWPTFGLVFTILAGLRVRSRGVPWLVGLYITAAYWFTASTSFANPAVAIARAFSDTFSGIRPIDRPRLHPRRACRRAARLGAGWLALARTEPRCEMESRAMTITIYHNPVLRHVPQHAGHDPRNAARSRR